MINKIIECAKHYDADVVGFAPSNTLYYFIAV